MCVCVSISVPVWTFIVNFLFIIIVVVCLFFYLPVFFKERGRGKDSKHGSVWVGRYGGNGMGGCQNVLYKYYSQEHF